MFSSSEERSITTWLTSCSLPHYFFKFPTSCGPPVGAVSQWGGACVRECASPRRDASLGSRWRRPAASRRFYPVCQTPGYQDERKLKKVIVRITKKFPLHFFPIWVTIFDRLYFDLPKSIHWYINKILVWFDTFDEKYLFPK